MREGGTAGDPFERLVRAAREGRDEGDALPAGEFLRARPDLVKDLRALLDAVDAGGPGPAGESVGAGVPRQLDDFRIVRQIGRGGMGIVYEAVQLSLNRCVALKVLAPELRGDLTLRRRFGIEARSAARLHHTNIVPVFAVGEHEGIPYYAMQFIRGAALGSLIRRLLASRAPSATALGVASPGDLEGTLALSLQTGRFPDPATEPGGTPPVEEPAGPGPAPGAPPGSTQAEPAPADPTADDAPPVPPAESPPTPPPTDGPWPALDGCEDGYCRQVVRIGVQVADALAYAHKQGVLHRDIKPSNLLLDVSGTAWVTDFGLAKAEGTEGVTGAGDILGTLRYVAPEAFEGRADRRGDVYGLGVTLYELLALRPAFPATDHARLMEQVRRGAAEPLRALNREVPRDLETIVAKAMNPTPAARYATADDLAEDLRRFLSDRPIRARRTGPLERLGRWARRNPLVAGLVASVGILLAAVAGHATLAAARLGTALERAERAERDVRRRLWESYVAQARAYRLGDQPGRRFLGLDALGRAAALGVYPDRRPTLRDEAIASLALADLRPAGRWECPPGGGGVGFDAGLMRVAVSDDRGTIHVRRVADDLEEARLDGPGLPAWRIDFSPDGRLLAARHHSQYQSEAARVRVWDIALREVVLDLPAEACGPGLGWAPDGRLAVCLHDGGVAVYGPASWREPRRIDAGARAQHVAFDPDGRRLAVACVEPFGVRVLDAATGRLIRQWAHPTTVMAVAWHPGGLAVASACDDHRVRVLDVADEENVTILVGHQDGLSGVAFHPGGDLLASTSWDGVLKVWDPWTGRPLVELASAWWAGPQFSADGRLLAGTLEGSSFVFWEPRTGRVCRTLRGRPLPHRGPWNVDYHPGGALMVVSSLDGVRLWDPAAGRPVGEIPAGTGAGAVFLPDGAHVATHGPAGLQVWPVARGPKAGLEVGPPRGVLGPPRSAGSGHRLTVGRAGDRPMLALTDPVADEAVVVDLARPGEVIRLPGNPDIAQAVLSPDGHWLATATFQGAGVSVWDLRRQVVAWRLEEGDADVAFSPDGRWLITGGYRSYRAWEVGTWRPVREWSRQGATLAGSVAFSSDGSMIALAHTDRVVRLVAAATGETLATLTAPDPRMVTELRFSPDDASLAVGAQGQLIQLWDLRLLRQRLVPMGLDWATPPPPGGAR